MILDKMDQMLITNHFIAAFFSMIVCGNWLPGQRVMIEAEGSVTSRFKHRTITFGFVALDRIAYAIMYILIVVNSVQIYRTACTWLSAGRMFKA